MLQVQSRFDRSFACPHSTIYTDHVCTASFNSASPSQTQSCACRNSLHPPSSSCCSTSTATPPPRSSALCCRLAPITRPITHRCCGCARRLCCCGAAWLTDDTTRRGRGGALPCCGLLLLHDCFHCRGRHRCCRPPRGSAAVHHFLPQRQLLHHQLGLPLRTTPRLAPRAHHQTHPPHQRADDEPTDRRPHPQQVVHHRVLPQGRPQQRQPAADVRVLRDLGARGAAEAQQDQGVVANGTPPGEGEEEVGDVQGGQDQRPWGVGCGGMVMDTGVGWGWGSRWDAAAQS